MVYVVIPAFNEEKNIGRVVRDLFEQQARVKNIDLEIGELKVVVVDDGSLDNTGKLAKTAGAIVIQHAVNRGQGAALQTGNEFALKKGAQIIIHFDADGQFNASDLVPALKLLKSNSLDVILGSRFLDNRSKVPFLKKYLLLPTAIKINTSFTGLKLTDAHNGFRILTRQAAKKITIHQDKMAHNSEIVSQIKEYKLNFAEFPVEVFYHRFGQGLVGGVRVLWDLLFSSVANK
jgi:polyprenyl-phospho-N-acetylgalactosaminyl synthase